MPIQYSPVSMWPKPKLPAEQRRLAAAGGAVEQPQQYGEGGNQQRNQMERRQGRARQRAAERRRAVAAPAPQPGKTRSESGQARALSRHCLQSLGRKAPDRAASCAPATV